jgi:hypothetical protein
MGHRLPFLVSDDTVAALLLPWRTVISLSGWGWYSMRCVCNKGCLENPSPLRGSGKVSTESTTVTGLIWAENNLATKKKNWTG